MFFFNVCVHSEHIIESYTCKESKMLSHEFYFYILLLLVYFGHLKLFFIDNEEATGNEGDRPGSTRDVCICFHLPGRQPSMSSPPYSISFSTSSTGVIALQGYKNVDQNVDQ